MKAVISYVKRRLGEHSTYTMIGAGIAAGAVLPKPWNIIFAVVAAIGAMFPDQPKPE